MKCEVCKLMLLIPFLLMLENCTPDYEMTSKISLPSIFSDNMVLQAGKPIMVWGKIDPYTKVTVRVGDNYENAVSDTSGRFSVELDEMDYGGPYTFSVIGKDTVELKNVMVGEVWLCSGQSNMQWQVSQSNNAAEEIENANYDNIRLFSVPRTVADTPQDDCIGEWSECSPQSVGSFSAVGYFFGRELFKNLDVPIGLIHSSWGGTPVESWMKYATLESDSDFIPILDRFNENLKEYPQKLAEYN